MRVALSVLVLAVLLAGAIGGAYALALHAIGTSQHQWCRTLSLLTSRPVPRPGNPSANPSREDAYVFYVHLRTLERDFGC